MSTRLSGIAASHFRQAAAGGLDVGDVADGQAALAGLVAEVAVFRVALDVGEELAEGFAPVVGAVAVFDEVDA
ncbi:MAG: hypothetical protein LBL33_03240, partial [Tannerella sp.]|nr:hypothetical protein [Tannerella sp.]